MALTDVGRLRALLGETTPEGGDVSQTLFTDDELQDLLDSTGSVERAAYEGWRIKAAHFSNLVNVTDGNASREMSDLLKNAERMIKIYLRTSSGPTEGRTRIGRIVRP